MLVCCFGLFISFLFDSSIFKNFSLYLIKLNLKIIINYQGLDENSTSYYPLSFCTLWDSLCVYMFVMICSYTCNVSSRLQLLIHIAFQQHNKSKSYLKLWDAHLKNLMGRCFNLGWGAKSRLENVQYPLGPASVNDDSRPFTYRVSHKRRPFFKI